MGRWEIVQVLIYSNFDKENYSVGRYFFVNYMAILKENSSNNNLTDDCSRISIIYTSLLHLHYYVSISLTKTFSALVGSLMS